jgi:hypothetical protein
MAANFRILQAQLQRTNGQCILATGGLAALIFGRLYLLDCSIHAPEIAQQETGIARTWDAENSDLNYQESRHVGRSETLGRG